MTYMEVSKLSWIITNYCVLLHQHLNECCTALTESAFYGHRLNKALNNITKNENKDTCIWYHVYHMCCTQSHCPPCSNPPDPPTTQHIYFYSLYQDERSWSGHHLFLHIYHPQLCQQINHQTDRSGWQAYQGQCFLWKISYIRWTKPFWYIVYYW